MFPNELQSTLPQRSKNSCAASSKAVPDWSESQIFGINHSPSVPRNTVLLIFKDLPLGNQ